MSPSNTSRKSVTRPSPSLRLSATSRISSSSRARAALPYSSMRSLTSRWRGTPLPFSRRDTLDVEQSSAAAAASSLKCPAVRRSRSAAPRRRRATTGLRDTRAFPSRRHRWGRHGLPVPVPAATCWMRRRAVDANRHENVENAAVNPGVMSGKRFYLLVRLDVAVRGATVVPPPLLGRRPTSTAGSTCSREGRRHRRQTVPIMQSHRVFAHRAVRRWASVLSGSRW
jgi:hypothetical protein